MIEADVLAFFFEDFLKAIESSAIEKERRKRQKKRWTTKLNEKAVRGKSEALLVQEQSKDISARIRNVTSILK